VWRLTQGQPRYGGTLSALSSLELEKLKARRTNRWPQKRNFVPSRHLWIGCLSHTNTSELKKIFTQFGKIDKISFLRDRHCAFIDFIRLEDSLMAFRAMQDVRVGDQVVELGFGQRDSSAPPPAPVPGAQLTRRGKLQMMGVRVFLLSLLVPIVRYDSYYE